MGISKAMTEKSLLQNHVSLIVQKQLSAGTLPTLWEWLASRGSVIPLFVDLIKSGKPLTITDPNMTRFMMTLEDAVDLVLYAFESMEITVYFRSKAPAATIQH